MVVFPAEAGRVEMRCLSGISPRRDIFSRIGLVPMSGRLLQHSGGTHYAEAGSSITAAALGRWWRTTQWWIVGSIYVAFQLFASSCMAEDKLQADLFALGPRARSGGPIPVEARFKWDGVHILEGHLEMQFCEG